MIFTELILENFGPYKGRHIIDLRPKIATFDSSKEKEYDAPIILFTQSVFPLMSGVNI